MRCFEVHRETDVSGVSGEGVVAVGVVTEAGDAIMKWFNEDNPRLETNTDGLSIKPAPDGVEATEEIHGHGGRTEVVWVDEHDHDLAAELFVALKRCTVNLESSLVFAPQE